MTLGISVFFPAYNDEASIAGLVGEALANGGAAAK